MFFGILDILIKDREESENSNIMHMTMSDQYYLSMPPWCFFRGIEREHKGKGKGNITY